jgi:hypothetical protein
MFRVQIKSILFGRSWQSSRRGQSIFEFALILPFYFFLFFFFIQLSFYLTEAHLGRYAAFMAARSYQVYGRQDESDLQDGRTGGSASDPIYKNVARDIIGSAFVYSPDDSAKIEILMDTERQKTHPTTFTNEENFPGYDTIAGGYYQGFTNNQNASGIKMYYMGNDDVDVDGGSNPDDLLIPRLGILKLTFPHAWNYFPWVAATIFPDHVIYMPYRLEPYLAPDNGA